MVTFFAGRVHFNEDLVICGYHMNCNDLLLRRHRPPFAAVLRHIQNCVDEIAIIRLYIASLNRKVPGNSLLPLAYFHVYRCFPGGWVALHETAEAAIGRGLREELGIQAGIVRPLRLNQSFSRRMFAVNAFMSCVCILGWSLHRAFGNGATASPWRRENASAPLNGCLFPL